MGKFFLIFMLLVPSVASGQTYLQTDEWERAATKRLVKELKASAKNGDGEAAFGLGNLFFNGKVIKEDYDEALKWYELAANNGYLKAKELMGDVQMKIFENGIKKETINNGEAMDLAIAIGNCYIGAVINTNVLDDKKRIAAKIYKMGEIWRLADGIDAFLDLDEKSTAVRYYHIAANNFDTDAARRLGLYYEKKLSNYESALKYFIIAADGGDFISQARAGVFLFEGKLVDKDVKLAYKYLRLACLNPDEDDVVDFIEAQDSQSGGIMHRLATCYRYGIGTTANTDCAEYWDILSALYGDTSGQEILTFNGLNISKDDPNMWQYVFMKFQPVFKRASANNASAEILYYISLTNSKDVSVSSQALNKLASLVDENTLDYVTKAVLCDFLLQVYKEAAKDYPEKKDFFESEAKKFAHKRKNIEVDEIMQDKWFLNTIRLSMRVL